MNLEILSCSVENMASHLLTEYITWSKSYQSLLSLESWNRCTCSSCTWLPFLVVQVCSQVWCSPYLAANFGFFQLQTFPWSPSKVEVGTFYPFTFKVGSKHSFIILKALVWSQQLKLAPLKSANWGSYYVPYCSRQDRHFSRVIWVTWRFLSRLQYIQFFNSYFFKKTLSDF